MEKTQRERDGLAGFSWSDCLSLSLHSGFCWPVRSAFQTIPWKHLALCAGLGQKMLLHGSRPLFASVLKSPVRTGDCELWGLECLALKPALYSQVLMTVFYQNQQMVILLYIECGTEEVLSFCWVLLTLGIFLHLLAGVFWISRILKRGKLRSVWLQYGIPVLLLVCRPR